MWKRIRDWKKESGNERKNQGMNKWKKESGNERKNKGIRERIREWEKE